MGTNRVKSIAEPIFRPVDEGSIGCYQSGKSDFLQGKVGKTNLKGAKRRAYWDGYYDAHVMSNLGHLFEKYGWE